MRNIATIHLSEYADEGSTTTDLVMAFLKEVGAATRPQIVGATDRVWSGVSYALDALILAGHVKVDTAAETYVYEWVG